MIPTISIFLEDILAMKLLRNVYTMNEIALKCGLVQDPSWSLGHVADNRTLVSCWEIRGGDSYR